MNRREVPAKFKASRSALDRSPFPADSGMVPNAASDATGTFRYELGRWFAPTSCIVILTFADRLPVGTYR
jgi:hypothetical protein